MIPRRQLIADEGIAANKKTIEYLARTCYLCRWMKDFQAKRMSKGEEGALLG